MTLRKNFPESGLVTVSMQQKAICQSRVLYLLLEILQRPTITAKIELDRSASVLGNYFGYFQKIKDAFESFYSACKHHPKWRSFSGRRLHIGKGVATIGRQEFDQISRLSVTQSANLPGDFRRHA